MGNAQQWEILPNGLIHNLNNNKYLEIARSNLDQKGVITYRKNDPISINQLWNITKLDKNVFIITTNLKPTLALSPSLSSSRLTLVNKDTNDLNQQWSFKPSYIPCLQNCNGHGVCSYSKGFFIYINKFKYSKEFVFVKLVTLEILAI